MQSPVLSFHLRLPTDLKDKLQAAGVGNGNSLNREIVERLERTMEPDAALQVADALRPFMASLDDKERGEAIAMITGFVNIVSRNRAKKKHRSADRGEIL